MMKKFEQLSLPAKGAVGRGSVFNPSVRETVTVVVGRALRDHRQVQ
jgi:hypothetical protein